MKYYKIVISVGYDEAAELPCDMEVQLRDNVERCIGGAELLNDSELQVIVDSWKIDVEEEED